MHFEPGDIWACFGADRVSRLISLATLRPCAPARLKLGPSHVAMCALHEGRPVWVESTRQTAEPCLWHRHHVSGAQMHTPYQRIHEYVASGGRVDVYRLVEIDRLEHWEAALLSRRLIYFVARGADYDLGGALISGTSLVKRLRWLWRDLESVFCAELLAAVLMRVSRLARMNATRFNPGYLLRRLVAEGTYALAGSFESPADVIEAMQPTVVKESAL